ncbi:hypothetical protein ACIBU0_39775 [Streptomyces sp. NPDC049627]
MENYQPPSRPGQEHPQQFHLDFELGATFRKVYTDPAGHPFCLCRNRPS